MLIRVEIAVGDEVRGVGLEDGDIVKAFDEQALRLVDADGPLDSFRLL